MPPAPSLHLLLQRCLTLQEFLQKWRRKMCRGKPDMTKIAKPAFLSELLNNPPDAQLLQLFLSNSLNNPPDAQLQHIFLSNPLNNAENASFPAHAHGEYRRSCTTSTHRAYDLSMNKSYILASQLYATASHRTPPQASRHRSEGDAQCRRGDRPPKVILGLETGRQAYIVPCRFFPLFRVLMEGVGGRWG